MKGLLDSSEELMGLNGVPMFKLLLHTEQTYGYQGKKAGWGELGDWNWHTDAIDTMYKTDN